MVLYISIELSLVVFLVCSLFYKLTEKPGMPQNRIHEQLSRKRTGTSFADLHEWMCGSKLTCKEYEQRHTIINILDNIPYVRKRWGETGVQEYLYHFHDDFERNKAIRLTNFFMKLPLVRSILKSTAIIYDFMAYLFISK
ncbi:metal dependent phosphohydrolase [Candidatus Scalindua japonica]|uniref:Metal dependent phosphohydrolase n=1 Tax=Candidatus Scalindua japonica TaxID=1284222 RepID=A0A286TX59_9BACT|nr:hypothetical protein [Candidatus Scalindua japonica]GAX60421.1 metal dependent phosphohydrolase [Candidatus Scalindua japonica]